MMPQEKTRTLCQRCAHAQRAAGGYVEKCTLNPGNPLEGFGLCARAGATGECNLFEPQPDGARGRAAALSGLPDKLRPGEPNTP